MRGMDEGHEICELLYRQLKVIWRKVKQVHCVLQKGYYSTLQRRYYLLLGITYDITYGIP